MANKRVFYACRRAGIAPNVGSAVPAFQTIRGLQSAGTTTTFKLEQVFELGQLAIYDNIEGVPDIEVTLEKVLDGYCPVYLLATQKDSNGDSPVSATLVARAPTQCIIGMQIYDESLSISGHIGVAESGPDDAGLQAEVHMSGLYVSSVKYQMGVERNITESITLVGNNKAWVIGGDTGNFDAAFQYGGGTWDEPWTGSSWPDGGVLPLASSGSGGVARRQDILMDPVSAVAAGAKAYCLVPGNIPGAVVGTGDTPSYWIGAATAGHVYTSGQYYTNPLSGGQFPIHIQTWNVHVDLGREQLHELGKLGTYYRYVNWPVEVVNEITVITTSGDMVSASEEGIYKMTGSNIPANGCGIKYNLNAYPIRLALCEGLIIDCGSMNKLRSVGMTGGDTGRGNVEVTYTYSNFNEFTVSHPKDVVNSLRP